jgi:ABC-2 type transport system permease protein
MSRQYSQFAAFLALTKASIKSMMKSPSSVVFSIAFPLVFILVFGFIGDRTQKLKIGIPQNETVQTQPFQLIADLDGINYVIDADSSLRKKLQEGSIDAIVALEQDTLGAHKMLTVFTGARNKVLAEQYAQAVQAKLIRQNKDLKELLEKELSIKTVVLADKEFKLIDFILPGQLGFSLLAASVFGTAFVFFHMRQMLVLKRFFATPIRKSVVLLSEGTARLVFQLIGALIIILIGKYFFNYTLVNGWITVINMLVVAAFGLLVFMSFGFIISGIAKSDSVIPPLANVFTMPQFLLAGTFFSVESLPNWLQVLAKAMPLTYFNNALRAIAFEGANIWDVWFELLIIFIWGLIGYATAAKLFKWE